MAMNDDILGPAIISQEDWDRVWDAMDILGQKVYDLEIKTGSEG